MTLTIFDPLTGKLVTLETRHGAVDAASPAPARCSRAGRVSRDL
jgi:hypothetical protein